MSRRLSGYEIDFRMCACFWLCCGVPSGSLVGTASAGSRQGCPDLFLGLSSTLVQRKEGL